MSTSGGYVPEAVPECSYAPRMTRAQALALRAGGGLLERCPIVITDGPTIGVPGFTSPTEIELQPTGPSELGLAALVHTTFDDNAWAGIFDIDLGTAGSIIRLTDHRNNTVVDRDADSPTVHTQFPWHLTGVVMRDNWIEDSTLTGWPTAGPFTCWNNTIKEATVNLTGAGATTLSGNNIEIATLNLTGSGPNTIMQNRIYQFFNVAHTDSGTFNFNGNDCYGVSPTGGAIVANSAGTTSVTLNEIQSGSTVTPTVDNQGASGTFTVGSSKVWSAARIAKGAGATGAMFVQNSVLKGLTALTLPAASTGGINVQASDLDAATITQNSTAGGNINIGSTPAGGTAGSSRIVGGSVVMAAAATRVLLMTNCDLHGATVQSSATNATGNDQILNSRIQGPIGTVAIDVNGASPVAGTRTVVDGCDIVRGGALVAGASQGTAGTQIMCVGTEISGGSVVTMGAGVSALNQSRIAAAATVNTGAFVHSAVVIEGQFIKTLTAANVNRRCTKGFDDIL